MPQEENPQSQGLPPLVSGPHRILSPEAFAKWLSFIASPEFLTRERLELLRKMSDNLARDPALLKHIERIFAEYGDDIHRVSPSDADLVKAGYGWTGGTGETGGTVEIVPAAAAAALAPPAAAMAAAHAPGD